MKLIITLILFYSCSSTNTVKTTYSEVADIKNSDFEPVKQIRYKKSDDTYKQVDSKDSSVTNRESLQRVIRFDGKLELVDSLSEIASLCYKDKFEDAFKIIGAKSRMYIKNPIFWNQVGNCYQLKGERRKALLFYNKALTHKKNYTPALNNLGVMYFYEKDYSRSLVAFKKAIRSGDFRAVPRLNLANLLLRFGLYDDAIKNAKGLLVDNAQDVDVLNLLGTAFLMKGNHKESLEYFRKIDRDYLETPHFGLNYAISLYQSGKIDDGKDALNDIDTEKLGEWKAYYLDTKAYMGVRK